MNACLLNRRSALAVPLLAAPHRTAFFRRPAEPARRHRVVGPARGGALLRRAGVRARAQPAPIWAHAYLMLFAVFPTIFFGFLFTVFPRWMNGPLVTRAEYVATAAAVRARARCCGSSARRRRAVAACSAASLVGLAGSWSALPALPRAARRAAGRLARRRRADRAVRAARRARGLRLRRRANRRLRAALRRARLALGRPAAGVLRSVPPHDPVLLAERRAGLRAWRPLWVLVAVVALAYARLLLGTAGALALLPLVDAALFVLTALCAVRWTSLARARQSAAVVALRRVCLVAASRCCCRPRVTRVSR